MDSNFICDECSHEFEYEEAEIKYFKGEELIACPLCHTVIENLC